MELDVDANGNPIIHQLSEEGFVDFTFRITKRFDNDDHYRFHMSGSHADEEVGCDAVIVKGIQGAFDRNMELAEHNIYRKGVRLIRSGKESDRLIAAMAELYEIVPPPNKMVEEETFTAIALQQGNIDFENETIKLKIFGKDRSSDNDDAYNESFFNVDLANGYVFWNEKDPDYREPLVQALAAE